MPDSLRAGRVLPRHLQCLSLFPWFRHSYAYGLHPAKVAALRDRWLSEADGVTAALHAFADKLEERGKLAEAG